MEYHEWTQVTVEFLNSLYTTIAELRRELQLLEAEYEAAIQLKMAH